MFHRRARVQWSVAVGEWERVTVWDEMRGRFHIESEADEGRKWCVVAYLVY